MAEVVVWRHHFGPRRWRVLLCAFLVVVLNLYAEDQADGDLYKSKGKSESMDFGGLYVPCDLRWLFLFGGLVSLLFSSSVISIHSGGMGTACADHCIQIQYKYMLGVTQRDS